MLIKHYKHASGYMANSHTPEWDKIPIHLAENHQNTSWVTYTSYISAHLLKFANYLINYAQYKNAPSRNAFYAKIK